VGATAGLLSLHAFGFVLGLGVTIVALGINGRSLFHRPQVRELQYGVTENQIGTAPQAPTSPRNIVIARFRNVPAASELLGTLPATRPASQFGQTVMVAFAPAEMIEQHELFNRFSKIADDVFVQSSQMAANVQLSFTMPDTAASKQSVAELEAYLEGLPGAKLIPPWADETVWPVQQRAEQTQLRLLLKQLQDPSAVPRFNLQRQQQIEAAQRSGDSAEADRLMALSKQEIEDAQRAHQQQLQQQFGHADFIRQWEQINQMKDWPKQNARMKQEIQPQLGQWPDGKPTDLLVTTGTVFDSGNDVRVFCTFNQTDTGLPAMAHWLFRCGATKMRYQITGVSVQPLETDDEPN
jgi:multidrug efflux pump subunit AcrA (membrane-fusion protein)